MIQKSRSSVWEKSYLATWLVSSLIAYYATLFLHFFFLPADQAQRFRWLLLFLVLMIANRQYLLNSSNRMYRYVWGLGFLLPLSTLLGLQLYQASSLDGWRGLFNILGASLGLFPSATVLICAAYHFCQKVAYIPATHFFIVSQKGLKRERTLFCGCAGFLFLCWLPVFLAYYPGIFAYDVYTQIPQVIEASYDTFHPLLHTLMLGGFYRFGGLLGSYSSGIAFYTIVQMMMIALVLAYSLLYLFQLGCPRIVRIIALLFFAFFPVCPLLAISATKDSLFAAAFLLFAVFLHQWYSNPPLSKNGSFMFRLILSFIILCHLRNNAVMAVGVCFALGFFITKKKGYHLRFVAFMLVGFTLFGVTSFGLQKAVHAKTGPVKEVLSVPLQQISRVYNLHQMELSVTEKIEELIPGVYAYTPVFADSVKAFCNVGINNLNEFLTLWMQMFIQYPSDYIDAFLLNTIGYWYLDDLSHSQIYGVGLAERQGYLLTDTKEGFGVEHYGLLPFLENLYERLFSANEYQSIPILSIMFSPAFYFWFFLFLSCYALYSKNKAVLLPCSLLFGYFLTMLLGPCVIIRYAFPFILCCPILLGLVFITSCATTRHP